MKREKTLPFWFGVLCWGMVLPSIVMPLLFIIAEDRIEDVIVTGYVFFLLGIVCFGAWWTSEDY